MSHHDEVDAFGRTILSKDRRVSDNDDTRRGRFDGRRDNTERSIDNRRFSRGERSSSRNRRPRSPTGGNYYDNKSTDWKRERDEHNEARALAMAGKYTHDRFQTSKPDVNSAAPQRVLPAMSFKSFMQTQQEDFPPETFQKMYDQYNIDYLNFFSEAFFKASMGEEWFQDRYNPVNITAMEQDSAVWACKESEHFNHDITAQTTEFISACSLDPAVFKPFKHQDSVETAEGTVSDMVELSAAGKHLPGHEDRTIYITGIHACCTKATFIAAITAALTPTATPSGENALAETLKLDRIVISQPIWSTRNVDKFERTAWVIMSNAVDAKKAIPVLRDLVVSVPGTADHTTGDNVTSFTFTVQATMHTPRQLHPLPDFMSYYNRVKADIARAMKLAELLDEDRGIPQEHSLKMILSNKKIVESVTKITEHLDIAIAYLRRVHFVVYYSGKRFRDEAHLLSMSSAVQLRSKTIVYNNTTEDSMVYSITKALEELDAVVSETTVEEMEEGGVKEDGTTAGNSEQKASEENGEVVDTIMEVSETKELAPKDATSEVTTVTTTTNTNTNTSSQSGQGSSITKKSYSPFTDRKIGPLIAELTKRVENKRARILDSSISASLDEEEAKVLDESQEKIYEQIVRSKCKFEPDDKCRCCYVYCNKLFKAISFLSKHLKTKHLDFARESSLREAEPYMRRRYEAEDILARPLPPVEVESYNGVELRSVKEILDRHLPRPQQALIPVDAVSISNGSVLSPPFKGGRSSYGGSNTGGGGDSRSGGGGRRWGNSYGGEESGGGGSYRDNNQLRDREDHHSNNRFANSGNTNPNTNNRKRSSYDGQPQDHREQRRVSSDGFVTFSGTGSSGDALSSGGGGLASAEKDTTNKRFSISSSSGGGGGGGQSFGGRKMNTYLDVDAPKETNISVDYGVAILPAMKKRKLSLKSAAAVKTVSGGEETTTTPAAE